jgi:hypothetical protein
MRRRTSWCLLISSAPLLTSAGSTLASEPTASARAAADVTPTGNPSGQCAVPTEAQAVDMTRPDRIVGNGSPASCSADAFIDAVALGGKIAFDCGPDPVVITLDRPAKVVNDAADDVVIDGGGLVTLSGGDTTRILYMNTCDPEQHWTTAHCDNQATPRLTVQNLTFSHGNSTSELEYDGGGAIWARGGQVKVIASRFFNNTCQETGPDVGGAALRVFSQYDNRPVYVVGSTFGGASGQGGVCSNGGALSSIGVSWVVLNSVMSHNSAVGNGANPARGGTPGGGSGGAIYTDGNRFTVRIAGSRIERNHANEGGGAVFFVSNDRTGTMSIESSTLRRNPSDGFETAGLPGIFFLGASKPSVSGSTLS